MAETTTTPAAGTSGTALVQAMQMGSGVDIQALATALAEAETQPKIDSYTSKKEASTVSVSGYGQLKGAISLVKLAFDNLKDVSDESGLSIEGLKQYDAFHRSELIRMWLDRNGYASPNENQMKEIEKSFFQSRHEADPVIKFQREDGQKKGVVLTKVNNYILPEELDE